MLRVIAPLTSVAVVGPRWSEVQDGSGVKKRFPVKAEALIGGSPLSSGRISMTHGGAKKCRTLKVGVIVPLKVSIYTSLNTLYLVPIESWF